MFAYVHFLDDGLQDIVRTEDIKGFNSANFNIHGVYWIRWKDTQEFFKGQILVVKETAEEINGFIEKSTRMRIPKILDPNPPEEETIPPVEREKKRAKDLMMNQKLSTAVGKKMNLQAILVERKEQLKCAHSASRKRVLRDDVDATESGDSDDEVVPRSLLTAAQAENKTLKRKVETLQGKLKELRDQNDTYVNLNINLQKCLVAKILNPTSSTPLASTLCPSAHLEHSQTKTTKVQVNNTPLDLSPGKDGSRVLEKKYMVKEDKIHIGEGVWIRADQWQVVNGNTKDSLFVKELAVTIWGSQTLAGRSLEGKSCPTTKTTPKPPLTPQKVMALKDCFRDWLQGKNLPEEEVNKRHSKAGRYVTEKMMDINKKQIKTKNPLD